MFKPDCRRWLSLSTIALVCGCSPDSLAPTPRSLDAALAAPARLSAPARIPNAVKYRDAGIRPAVGRSGSATLEGRALLGRDGRTLVEISTGSLEAGTSVGNIDKSQLAVSAGGPVQNYNRLDDGGYWSGAYQGLARGATVSVQANVSGIDANRTDVVAVDMPVALRPDLAVTAVNAPDEVHVGDLVTVSAAVSEINRDVGARANCVLAVGGVVTAQSTGIWVDAGSAVNCLFVFAFTTAGTTDVRISLEAVNPGDWDTANNSANRSVTVRDPSQPIRSGLFLVREHVGGFSNSASWSYIDIGLTNTTTEAYYSEDLQVLFGGVDPEVFQPRMDSLNLSIAVDGVVRRALATPLQFQYEDAFQRCTSYTSGSERASVCSSHARWGRPAQTQYNYDRFTGEATYVYSVEECFEMQCSGYYQVGTYGDGERNWGLEEGSQVEARFVWTDSTGMAHTFERRVAVGSRAFLNVDDGSCTTYPSSVFCWRYRNDESWIAAFLQW